jgi:hypothetical protein
MRATLAWLAAAAFSLGAALPAPPCRAANAACGEVMALLAQRQHGEVKYVEEDYYAMLDRPLKSSGVLLYDAPDHLEKRELEPHAQSLILDGETLTMRRANHRAYRLDLSAYPQVAPLVDSIRDTLAGNEGALERMFKVTFSGTLASWKLELRPLRQRLAGHVQQVQITGSRDEIRTVKILDSNGDHSVMTVAAPAP